MESNLQHQESELQETNDIIAPTSKTEHPIWEIIRFALISLAIILPIRWYIAEPFIVSGSSMDDTFHNADYLIVDQVTYNFENIKRGDVVIFHYPKDPSKFFIKRIIALPGESIVVKDDTVTIFNDDNPSGFTIDEPYIKSMDNTNDVSATMSTGEYFVMGDNRDHSSDSRAWGKLSEEEITGRVLLRLFPFNQIGVLPGHFEFNN